MLELFFTLIIGLIAGYIFLKLKVPGGMMVGSIVAIAAFNVTTDIIYMPSIARTVAQIIAGAFIGSGIEKGDLVRLKYITKPAITLIGGMLILNIVSGFLIYFTSPLDLVTSFMCAVPGGMSDMPLISIDMGADSSKVVAMQFVRMVFGIGVFPSIIAKVTNYDSDITEETIKMDSYKRVESVSKNYKSFITTLILATIFGIIGKLTKIPSATMVFPMLIVIALKLYTGQAFMPKWMKKFAQVLSGAYIGSGIGMKEVVDMKVIIIPATVLILGYLIGCFLIGKVLNSKFNIPIRDAMLAAIPAGASDMALISADLGVQNADVIVLQVIRLISVIAIFPQVIMLIVNLVGN